MHRRTLVFGIVPLLFIFMGSVSGQEHLCDTAYEDCRTPLWSLIDQETVGIDVAFWFMQDTSLSSKIINRFKAGVPVRILVDPRANPTYAGNEQILNEFRNAGIPMRYKNGGGILHWKMMLFAGQGKLEFSGANFSANFFVPTSPNSNYIDEAIYFTDDVSLIQSFKTKYDDLWTNTVSYANYANIAGPLTRTYPTFPIDPELNFPPSIDGSQDFFNRTQLNMNQETQKIDIIMYRITNQRYTDTTIDAVRRGIPVRLIHEPDEYRNPARQWDSWNVDRMYMAGVQIKMRKHLGLNHQKSVLLYGKGMTIFGSSNWTGPSSNSQEEHNYFTTKPWFFQWFADQFEWKWNSTTDNEPFVPLGPNQPSYSSPSNGAIGQPSTISLRWEGGRWAHKYDIYFGTSPNPPLLVADVSTIQSGAVPGQPLLDTGSVDDGVVESYTIPVTLAPGTTYYWRVVGKTMANKSASGPTWNFVTSGSGPAPPAPTGLTASAVSSSRIDLTWVDTSNETGYRIERSPNGSSSWLEIASPAVNQTGYSDLTVSAQQTYYYRIRALNSGGFSPYSNVANATTPQNPPPTSSDIVLWASEAPVRVGNWTVVSDASAAGGSRIWNPDAGAPKRTTPLATPADYFELTFQAQSGVDYRIWVRSKAQNNFWGNDSVFMQFSGTVNSSGSSIYRIGTTSAAEMNLEDCSGCGIQGWGWQDNGWGAGVLGPVLRFATSGSQTIRIQVREDGLSIDQIVISPQTYLNSAPGTLRNDTTILAKSNGSTTPTPIVNAISPTSGPTAGGTAISISGSNFVSGATVSLGGAAATNVTVLNSGSITATTASRSAGTVNVIVANPDGQNGTLANGFAYVAPVPAPILSSITPSSGSTAGGTSVTISGSNFQTNASVTIGGTFATSVSVVNSTTITALTPAHAAGIFDVVVTNPDGQRGTKSQAFTYVTPQTAVPQFDRVFIVVIENQSYANVINSPAMPYLNALADRYGLATNYFANTQPSIGNYFWLTTGQEITNDSNFSGTVTVDNIARQINFAGKTWKSYSESLPSVGYTGGDVYPYVKRHNPFAYLSDVLNNPNQANNLVPFTQFASDLNNNQLPHYSFIIPNQQNNAHDCPAGMSTCTNADKLAAADSWLKANIDPLLAHPAFRQNGLLVITFDESVKTDLQHGGGHIATLVISPKAQRSYQSTAFYQHQSTLRLMAEGLGLQTYPGASATAPNMSEFFGTAPNTAPSITSVSPSSGPTGGGTSVTISGTGFAAGATVSFGGTLAGSSIVVGSTTINVVAPPHASGTVNVVVTNPGGESATLVNGYTYGSAPAETVLLADDFNDGALNTSKWIANNLYSGFTDATVAVRETQRLEIGPLKQNVDGSHYNGIKSASAHNFLGSYVQVQIVQAPSSATAADAFFTIGRDVNNCYRVYVESGTLILQTKLGGVKRQPLTLAFDPVNHAFWRFRHDATTGGLIFETAPANGDTPGTWTQRHAEAWNTSAVPLSNLLFELKAGTWRVETGSAGTVMFDNFKAAKP